jgi:isoaspartyl peptidase/L-asparaginase-like protein (Ntn-hydrolase superfamily)|tara:strand:- start:1047 stop:1286 length:240 start_codon:yes stop_codon:yes gene_type:complete
MIEWIQNNWTSVVGTVAVIGGGMYIPVVRGLVLTGLKTMISETVLKKIAIQIVEKLVKSTKNKLDDVWFAEFKKKVDNA